MKPNWKRYTWQSQGELWLLPVIGFSWPPNKGKAFWMSWFIWNVAWIDDSQYRYTHVHKASI